jgi:hypothetical protein
MSTKRSLVIGLIGLVFLVIGILIWATTPTTSAAQCGDVPPKSSCITCHEKEDPVHENGEWHDIHALKDCCTSCHGGNCMASEKDLAHESLVANPLEDIYTSCYSCHPDDYQARAVRFAAILGVTPGSSPTATSHPVAEVVEHPIVILPPSSPSTSLQPFWLSALGGFTLLFITLLTLAVVFYILHIQKHTVA